jgi:hypothetical protein
MAPLTMAAWSPYRSIDRRWQISDAPVLGQEQCFFAKNILVSLFFATKTNENQRLE